MELLINHKKMGQFWLQNLSFLFLPVNFESGLTSLPFLLARSCNLTNYLTCSMCIQKYISFQHHAIDTFIATLSVLYAVKPYLLFLDPVSALLHTLPPNVLQFLPPTLKPGDHTNELRKAQLSVLLTYILLHIFSYQQTWLQHWLLQFPLQGQLEVAGLLRSSRRGKISQPGVKALKITFTR